MATKKAPKTRASKQDVFEAFQESIQSDTKMNPIAKKALLSVNKIRNVLGLELLRDLKPGQIGQSQDCPIYNSLMFGGADALLGDDGIGGSSVTFVFETREQAERVAKDFKGEGAMVDKNYDGTYTVSNEFEEFGEFVSAFDGLESLKEGDEYVDDPRPEQKGLTLYDVTA